MRLNSKLKAEILKVDRLYAADLLYFVAGSSKSSSVGIFHVSTSSSGDSQAVLSGDQEIAYNCAEYQSHGKRASNTIIEIHVYIIGTIWEFRVLQAAIGPRVILEENSKRVNAELNATLWQ